MKSAVCAIYIFLCFFNSAQAQKVSFVEKRTSYHTYVKGVNFEGVIFSEDFAFPFLSQQSKERRFTPTTAEIETAESLLAANLKSVNQLKINQGGENGPVIHENLSKFVRQYYGYISQSGEKIVFISCLLKANYTSSGKELPNWLKGAVVVLNGGSNYWQVQANLKSNSLFGLSVNSLAKAGSR